MQVFAFSFVSTSVNERWGLINDNSVRVTFERDKSQPHKTDGDEEADRARGNENILTFLTSSSYSKWGG